jgi:RHS repeat-associated protein
MNRCGVQGRRLRGAPLTILLAKPLILIVLLLIVGGQGPPELASRESRFGIPTIVPTDAFGGTSAAPAAGDFAVSSDGAGTYVVPIWTPEGRRGIEPSISLAYNSRNEKGISGVGWSLRGLSEITRCKRDISRDGYNAAITFSQLDAFCLDGQRLVTYPNAATGVTGGYGDANTEYRTEQDRFIRIISGTTDDLGPLSFQLQLKDGRTYFYGTTPDSRLEGPRFKSAPLDLSGTDIVTDFSQRVRLRWSLAKITDRFGNNLTVQYSITGDPTSGSGLEQLLEVIQYTGTEDNSLAPQRSVNFHYEARPDPSTSFVSGLQLQIRSRLTEIVLSAPNPTNSAPVKSYKLNYQTSSASGRSLLNSISECDPRNICLSPTTFSYSVAIPDGFFDIDTGIHDDTATSSSTPSVGPRLGQLLVGDWNGDGCDDFAYSVVDTGGNPLRADYRLSACYDAMIVAGTPLFPAPSNPASFQLSGAAGSSLPLSVFAENSDCTSEPCIFKQLFALDMDLDGRADLVNYSVIEQSGANTKENVTTAVYLASAVPPARWDPSHRLFGGGASSFTVASQPAPLTRNAPPYYFTSLFVGDINGDGYPDLIRLLPGGWSVRLSHGRSVSPAPLVSFCPTVDDACMNLGSDTPFFSGRLPAKLTLFKNFFMVDIDNDGTTDLLLRDPSGPNWYAAFSFSAQNYERDPINLALAGGERFGSHDWFVDVNGDGLPDCISIPVAGPAAGEDPTVSLNTGNGFTQPASASLNPKPSGDALLIVDYDGDGRQDIVFGTASGLTTGELATDGKSFSTKTLVDQNLNPIPTGTGLQAFDANGDGLADFIQVVNGTIHVYVRRGGKRDLLTSANDRGAQILVRYSPITSRQAYGTTVAPGVVSTLSLGSNSSPTYVVNRGVWVVSSYVLPQAGSGNPSNTYTLSYTDGRRSLHGHGWLGFAGMQITNEQTHLVSSTNYDNYTMVGTAYPYAMLPKLQKTAVKLSSNSLIHENQVSTTYQAFGTSDGKYLAIFPMQRHSDESEFETTFFGVSRLVRRIRSFDDTLQFDGFGNITSIVRKSGDGWTNTQTASFQYNIPQWLVALPQKMTHTSTTPGGQSQTRTTTFEADNNTGGVLSHTLEPTAIDSTFNFTTYTPDAHGMITAVTSTDINRTQQRTLSVTFDTKEDMYPTMVTNPLGQSAVFTIHPGLSLLASHRDPNGVVQRWQYDGFGRLKNVLSSTNKVRVAFDYSGGPFSIRAKYSSGETISILYDPYLYEIERDSLGFDGKSIVRLRTYNNQNLVSELQGPCFYGPAPCGQAGFTHLDYDELGRLVGLRRDDGSTRTWGYDGLRTTSLDELGNRKYRDEDQIGRVQRSVSIGAAGQEIPTTYTYEPFGLVNFISDAAGHVVRLRHDGRGRLAILNDPELGDRFYGWNAFDEISSDQDGNGFTKTYVRDLLGRIKTITDKDGITTIDWDTATHGIGKPASATAPNGTETQYEYDNLSRIAATTSTIDGISYQFRLSYDQYDRVDTITYPSVGDRAPFAVQRKYNPYGFLNQVLDVRSGKQLWITDARNERAQITAESLGNAARTTRVFDTRGFLKTKQTTSGGKLVQDLEFTYYPTGSLHTRLRREPLTIFTESFQYDPLDRLSEWTLYSENRTAPIPVIQPLLDQKFTFDDIGNLKARTTLNGPRPSVTLTYGQSGAGPHAVTDVNGSSYGYDHGGNQINGPNRVVTYDASDLPVKIDQGARSTQFVYGPGHERVLKKTSPSDFVVTVGGLYERRVEGGKETQVFHVLGRAMHPVAQVEWLQSPAADQAFYLHRDNLDSVHAVTDSSGAMVGERWYEPFGQSVAPASPANNSAPGIKNVSDGFTGSRTDADLNLIDMNARIYDPAIGRFLAADPLVQAPLLSESLNRYSYAWNNPLKWVDPTGYQDEGNQSLVPPIVGSPTSGGESPDVGLFTTNPSPNDAGPGDELPPTRASDNGNPGSPQSVTRSITSPVTSFAAWKAMEQQNRRVNLSPEQREVAESDEFWAPASEAIDKAVYWASFLLRYAAYLGGPELGAVVNMGLDTSDERLHIDTSGGPVGDAARLALGTGMSLSRMTASSAGTTVHQVLENAERGGIFERQVIDALGVSKNTHMIEYEFMSASGKTRLISAIPDVILPGSIVEIKDWEYIHFSGQIQAEVQYALSNNIPMVLIVSPQTEVADRALTEIMSTRGGVVIFNPATGRFRPFLAR